MCKPVSYNVQLTTTKISLRIRSLIEAFAVRIRHLYKLNSLYREGCMPDARLIYTITCRKAPMTDVLIIFTEPHDFGTLRELSGTCVSA